MARPGTRHLTEAGLLAAAAALLLTQAAHALHLLRATETSWLLPAAFVLGILGADFATGATHWFCDRFFAVTTPILGDALIRPFREHHDDPRGMVGHGFLELHGNSAIPVIAALGLVQLARPLAEGAVAAAFHAWLVFFCATALATNQFHMWAHAPSAPHAVRWAQRRGLILSPERHALHHSGGFDRSYCMTSGWMNPLLDRTDFFGRIERGLFALRATVGR